MSWEQKLKTERQIRAQPHASAWLSSNNWATLFVLQLKLMVIWGYSLYNAAFLFAQKRNEVLESALGHTLFLWKSEKELENCCLKLDLWLAFWIFSLLFIYCTRNYTGRYSIPTYNVEKICTGLSFPPTTRACLWTWKFGRWRRRRRLREGSAGLTYIFYVTVGTAVGMLRETEQRTEAGARTIAGRNGGKETQRS